MVRGEMAAKERRAKGFALLGLWKKKTLSKKLLRIGGGNKKLQRLRRSLQKKICEKPKKEESKRRTSPTGNVTFKRRIYEPRAIKGK